MIRFCHETASQHTKDADLANLWCDFYCLIGVIICLVFINHLQRLIAIIGYLQELLLFLAASADLLDLHFLIEWV